ncbi:MAG: aromatic ring-hydroxylating dioxygenase subunit alpha [Alphaproteobacteria bacterium]|nr:aromatic ring-hydroxylating dioxygenase subunit alpha [Alphaproteobacteria bacterium]MBU6474116.1 aromatic ring-hydroxylating dioxygenase subunit alpha [Alphaproteobacteria bacterium]MDE2012559.1 aromatic ring-hydroxylating dioxygenase subunit alpha [Alphaproteobacteria bacterium]MDE2072940.1 aromatic ring-hydroxylating dioxygenase subunit alpha [Alphaproteobacteria bacterium]MDE2351530.1 aromatic ring-hydroxylating dioxygenase subunit alpha [Alphaproteobacteria bacterium]
MRYLGNAWYQAAWSDEVVADGLLGRTLLDRPVVFFRDAEGAIVALDDRCPHRFAPLSRGRVKDGTLYCGYHGLGFDATGGCSHNPHGPIPKRAAVRRYPALERHDAIWIWPGDPARADPALLPDLGFIDVTPATAKLHGYLRTAANYQLLSDNILDLSHADYLHPDTLGGIMTKAAVNVAEQEGRLSIRWDAPSVEPPPAFKAMVPEGKADIWTEVTWTAPAVMILNTGAVPTGQTPSDSDQNYVLHNMTPETASASHYFYCPTRRNRLDDAAFTAVLKQFLDQAFLSEDKPMIEAQQSRMETPDLFALKPVLLSVDAGAIRARRMLQRRIDAESAND